MAIPTERPVLATAPSPSVAVTEDMPLSDDDLEVVVGGLARALLDVGARAPAGAAAAI